LGADRPLAFSGSAAAPGDHEDMHPPGSAAGFAAGRAGVHVVLVALARLSW
jgi:hypothetical protein